MRILHISTRLILGGSQENTVLSCEGQARLGHDVHLAFGPIYGPEGSLLDRVQKFRTSDGRGVITHIVPNLVREVDPARDKRATNELGELITRLQPDIVHTHSSKAGILGRIAAWDQADRPGIVHTIHGPPFMPVEGSQVRRFKIRLNNFIYTLAERHAARRCDVIVSVAEAMTRLYLSKGIGTPTQYTTVYSGMETDSFLTAAPGQSRDEVRAFLGLSGSDFVIGTVARLAEHKGHDDLLSALAPDLALHADWKLLWVGDGWWRERLIQRARSMNLGVRELDKPGSPAGPASIILTGLVPPERVPGLVRSMDVLAHPSYREGLPRTVPQALLAGTVPLAYDCDGTGEVCRDMQTGRLVKTGDFTGLREAARWLYDHPEERRRFADRGKAECAERFSVRAMVENLEKVYARAIELSATKQ